MASHADPSFPRPPFEHSDTPYASSDHYPPTNDEPHPLQAKPRYDSLSKVSRSRALSTVSSSSSVRRKPLPADASPVATRYSTGEHLTKTVELPKRGLTRPFSIDSPTVYDFIAGAYLCAPPSPTPQLPETPELPEPDSGSDLAQ